MPARAHPPTGVSSSLHGAWARLRFGQNRRRAPDVVHHHADVRVAALGSHLECCRDDPLDARRQGRRRERAPGLTGLALDQQLPEQHPQRIHIARLGRLTPLNLLGRTIGQRKRVAQVKPDRSPVRGRQLGPDEPDAFAVVDHEDRIGAELAVNEPIVMERLERLPDPDGDAQRRRHVEGAAGIENFTESGALDPLERHEALAGVRHAELVHPLHAAERVGRGRERARLSPHRGHEWPIARELVSHDLERDRSAVSDVLGAVQHDVAAHRGDGVDSVARPDDGTRETQAEFGCGYGLWPSADRHVARRRACCRSASSAESRPDRCRPGLRTHRTARWLIRPFAGGRSAVGIKPLRAVLVKSGMRARKHLPKCERCPKPKPTRGSSGPTVRTEETLTAGAP